MNTLVAIRDKYRARAIRTHERGMLSKMPSALNRYAIARDYYIYAAEAVECLINGDLYEPSFDVAKEAGKPFPTLEPTAEQFAVDFGPESLRSDLEESNNG